MKIAIDARGAVWFRGTGIGTYTYQLVRGLTRELGHNSCFSAGGFEDAGAAMLTGQQVGQSRLAGGAAHG